MSGTGRKHRPLVRNCHDETGNDESLPGWSRIVSSPRRSSGSTVFWAMIFIAAITPTEKIRNSFNGELRFAERSVRHRFVCSDKISGGAAVDPTVVGGEANLVWESTNSPTQLQRELFYSFSETIRSIIRLNSFFCCPYC